MITSTILLHFTDVLVSEAHPYSHEVSLSRMLILTGYVVLHVKDPDI